MKVAYLGLGVIGRGMCGNLLARGAELTVWNRTASRAEELVKAGARQGSTPAEAVRGADVVCVCVSDTPDVEAVVFGEGGALEGMEAGAVLIDFSTISAAATEEFSRRAAKKGIDWVDAPVSGGDVGARQGTLTIMAGGDPDVYQRVLPVLQMVGKNIHHMGGVGSGQRTKMANQVAVAGTIASMGEALAFAREQGMDLDKVLEVISSGAAGSWSLSNYGPRLLRGDYNPGFSIDLMLKDLRIVLDAMEGLESEYTVTRYLADIYKRMADEGRGHLGNHAAALEMGWKLDSGEKD
ncbi:MAG: NAD(P)-dependent oxidoreductase [Candidatus Sumerlaeia bacterium]|nr:NAD(P)-dependent oxidoreductase [Candidatus Sumerlaeia bacterium]